MSNLVTLTNTRNDKVNSNTDHEDKDGNEQNTICNRRIEHVTTATILNNISPRNAPLISVQKNRIP